MNRKIVLYIAESLDGFIARKNGPVDWLVGHGDVDNSENEYDVFYNSVDTVVMGRTTFEQIINELSPDKYLSMKWFHYYKNTKDIFMQVSLRAF